MKKYSGKDFPESAQFAKHHYVDYKYSISRSNLRRNSRIDPDRHVTKAGMKSGKSTACG
jgi:hypothetical protein